MTIEIGIWEFIGGIVGILVVVAAAVERVVRNEGRQRSHEDVCAVRYAQIAAQHARLVDESNERHTENLGNFRRLDEKLDRLLERAR